MRIVNIFPYKEVSSHFQHTCDNFALPWNFKQKCISSGIKPKIHYRQLFTRPSSNRFYAHLFIDFLKRIFCVLNIDILSPFISVETQLKDAHFLVLFLLCAVNAKIARQLGFHFDLAWTARLALLVESKTINAETEGCGFETGIFVTFHFARTLVYLSYYLPDITWLSSFCVWGRVENVCHKQVGLQCRRTHRIFWTVKRNVKRYVTWTLQRWMPKFSWSIFERCPYVE